MSKANDKILNSAKTIKLTNEELLRKEYKTKLIYSDDSMTVYGALNEIRGHKEYHVIVINNKGITDTYTSILNLNKKSMCIINRIAFLNKYNGYDFKYNFKNVNQYSRFIESIK